MCNICLSDHKTFVYQMTKLNGQFQQINVPIWIIHKTKIGVCFPLKRTFLLRWKPLQCTDIWFLFWKYWSVCAIFVYFVQVCHNICVFCSGMSQYLCILFKNVKNIWRFEFTMFRYTGGERFSVCFWNSEEGSKSVNIYIYNYIYPPRICDSNSYFTYISLMSNSSTFRCICSTQFCNK